MTDYTKEDLSYLRTAYAIADENQENVYWIKYPREGLGYAPKLPYLVLNSQSDSWERDNGILIQFRVICDRIA